MIPAPDRTLDPARRSWVGSADEPRTDFPLQNLPYGVFQPAPRAPARVGVAIGESVLDLRATADAGLLDAAGPAAARAAGAPDLSLLMALPPADRAALRRLVHDLLDADAPRAVRAAARAWLAPVAGVELLLPLAVPDFVDFFASRHHAARVAEVVPGAAVPASYAHLPLGSHARTSSIVVSGTGIRRPAGQRRSRDGYVVRPTRRLDFEMELGIFVGPGWPGGRPLPIAAAPDHLFGLCLLNDWSARDVQALESVPLGPFLSKSFATTIAPWVVTMEALAPFRVPLAPDTARDAACPGYLADEEDRRRGAVAVRVEVGLLTAAMRARGAEPVRLAAAAAADLHWTPAQLLTHLASGGAPLRAGELVGTGTLSGPRTGDGGCLLELTRGGQAPVAVGDEARAFLEDGDEVIFRAVCEAEGAAPIGFGECRGRVLAAV